MLDGGPDVVQELKELTGGGAHAVIDFVGELGAEQLCWQMLRQVGPTSLLVTAAQLKSPPFT